MNVRRALIVVTFLAGAVLQTAAAGPAKWSASNTPPWLVVHGRPVALSYDVTGSYSRRPTGAVFVRSGAGTSFTRVALTRAGGGLVARVPARLVTGDTLAYYAVLQEPSTGRSVTVPAGGARSPQRVWVVQPAAVALGAHRFGHLSAPGATVASAAPDEVGFPEPSPGGGCGCGDVPHGPLAFDVARDGSIWLLDELNHRLLVWRANRPAHPARSLDLARLLGVEPKDLAVRSFALGAAGTVYVDATDLGSGHTRLYALTSAGRVRWQAPIDSDSLRLGPDGVLYTLAGPQSWRPLTSSSGRPLTPAEQRRETRPFQPLPGGLRLVTSQPNGHDVRLATVDRAGRVVHAWRVTSRTTIALTAREIAPALVGGDVVVSLDVSRTSGGKFLWERVVLRLTPAGAAPRRIVLDARSVWGDEGSGRSTPLRIASDGRLYQLRTDPKLGVRVVSYSLGR